MTEPCKGENCPRRESCSRYLDGLYFRPGRPFTSTLCEWVGTEYLDYYIPVVEIHEQQEAAAQ